MDYLFFFLVLYRVIPAIQGNAWDLGQKIHTGPKKKFYWVSDLIISQ